MVWQAYLAISMSGGIAVPIDAQLGPEEIWNLLSDSASRVLFHSSKTGENVKKISDNVSLNQGSGPVQINFDSEEFRAMCRTPQLTNYPEVSGEDIASIIYTSGTTGVPKGVLLSHKNFCSDVEAILQIRLIEPGDNFISILPYHHTYPFMGNLILPISSGLTITFPPSLKGPELLTTVREKGCDDSCGGTPASGTDKGRHSQQDKAPPHSFACDHARGFETLRKNQNGNRDKSG